MVLVLLLACGSAAPAPPPPTGTAPTAPTSPVATPPAAPPPTRLHAPGRLVAVGDLHGDLVSALDVLRLAGVVDAAGAWTGGTSWLVQTGDVVDRGPDSRGVIALLERLEAESAAAGGRVIALDGNHEVMNLLGDWRYVSPEDLAGYGGEPARKAAWAPDGHEGRWTIAHDVVAQVDGTIFVHGGIDAHWGSFGVRGLNGMAHAAMRRDGPPEVLGSDGPLWNRTYLLEDPVTACPELGRALLALGADRMVVGHTTQESGRVAERCGGRLWGIDTGVSAHYGRHLAALEIVGDSVRPIYPPPQP
jgi:hypothetical protein